jgi:agmatinase
MPRLGGMYGPDVTFLGVARCDLEDPSTFAGADVVIIGAPYDAGASYRAGARFGPQVIRTADYGPHDSSRPHLALRVDPLRELRVVDAGDIEMPGVEARVPLDALEKAVRTAFLANRVVLEMLAGIAFRRQGGTWASIPKTMLEGR